MPVLWNPSTFEAWWHSQKFWVHPSHLMQDAKRDWKKCEHSQNLQCEFLISFLVKNHIHLIELQPFICNLNTQCSDERVFHNRGKRLEGNPYCTCSKLRITFSAIGNKIVFQSSSTSVYWRLFVQWIRLSGFLPQIHRQLSKSCTSLAIQVPTRYYSAYIRHLARFPAPRTSPEQPCMLSRQKRCATWTIEMPFFNLLVAYQYDLISLQSLTPPE